ncbi:MAG: DUF2911 domain-containing protein [Sphingobacteriales bacterium]|nr:MAG: DUF2911 domain-containing protein [Sphingobacteriales bacterium]
MKYGFFFLICMSIDLGSIAQLKFPETDKSPLDVSYYPNNYPLLKIQGKATEPLLARVFYSRPQKSNRVVFGELIEFNKVWRLGANEATEIEFFQNVKFGDTKVKKGRYTLYCIPMPEKWTLILNKDTDSWGSFIYDAKKDVARVDVPVEKQLTATESFSMLFEKMNGGFNLNIGWDSSKVSLPLYLQ